MKKIHLINIGCKVNFAETSHLKQIFSSRGYEISDTPASSDIVLINTCSVTNKADADSRAAIRRARRLAPNSFIGVLGCFAQLKADEIKEMPEVNGVFGINEKFMIPDILEENLGENPKIHRVSDLSELHFDPAFSSDEESRSRGFLKIQDGCDYNCSYCTIPQARGYSRSIDFLELQDNLSLLEKSDYKEIVISGINLGEYESQCGSKFIDVLRLLSKGIYNFRTRVSSIEPNLINDEAIDLICNSDSICPHFHVPLQSGSDAVLKLMKRRYITEMFRQVINKIHETNPNACIGIDVICGFPGETDIYFNETHDFLQSLPVSYLHVFSYSERDNTPAASMTGKVPHNIRKDRTNKLRELSEIKYEAFCKSQIGKKGIFLPETFKQAKGAMIGHTENYVKCAVKTDEALPNELFGVRYDDFRDGVTECKLV